MDRLSAVYGTGGRARPLVGRAGIVGSREAGWRSGGSESQIARRRVAIRFGRPSARRSQLELLRAIAARTGAVRNAGASGEGVGQPIVARTRPPSAWAAPARRRWIRGVVPPVCRSPWFMAGPYAGSWRGTIPRGGHGLAAIYQ